MGTKTNCETISLHSCLLIFQPIEAPLNGTSVIHCINHSSKLHLCKFVEGMCCPIIHVISGDVNLASVSSPRAQHQRLASSWNLWCWSLRFEPSSSGSFQFPSLSSPSVAESILNLSKTMLVLRNRNTSDAFSSLLLGIIEGKHLTVSNRIV